MGKGLIDEVFSWSLSDILDEELYKEKVEKIPDSFQAVDQYFASFVYPLLEETRAQLASSLEKVSRAPYAQVTYFDSTKQNGKLYYDIEVDYWRNRCGVDGERSYRTFAGDYFVFTDAKPEAVSDLPQLERGWALLSKITENKNGDGHTLTFLRVLTSKEIQVKLSSGRPLFIVFLMNMRTNERIWNSLQMGGNMNVIKQILCSPTQDEKNYALCRARGNCLVFEEYIRTLPSELNKSQRKVVVDILYRIECNHRSFVELILGPPGTGKTRTLSIFLYTLLRMNRRSLVCAPTDVAIAELASRVLKLVKESSEASYLLGRILYFGDQGLSGVNAHIGEIYMDHQVETLDSSSRLLTASLIFCTASSSYALHSVLANKLNLLIVDEAAQLKECELSIPLQLPGVRHSVLFGDHCQLSATVTSNASARAGFGRSLFERLISIGHSKHILDMQYRMHPLISLLPNSEFYGNQILDAPNVKNKRYKKCIRLLPLFGPYSFINVSCGREEMDSFTCSFKNMVEVAMVTKIIRKLFKAWGKSKEMLSVGIVATYTAQVIAIKEKVGQKYDSFDRFSLKVSTIDGFQGGEEDVIIFSTVRSNAKGSVGDISNRQRTNVALTRARCCLWIVGDGRTLFDSNTVWKSIVQDAKDRNCFYNAEEDEDLADVVLEVKKEMDQLDDFLNADSLLFKNARWKVLFSDNFRKSFEKLKSSETKKLILNLLLRLSCGWRPKRRSTNLVCDDFSQMLKQFKVKDLHIICSIDVVKDSCYIQVLKVWDILPLEDIPLLVDHLSTIFQSYTDEFIKRCKVKCLEGDLEVPKSWNSCISRYKRDCVQSGNNSSAFVESCKSSDSFLLMKFYALSAGVVSHLLSGCDGNEIDFLFELTEEEKDIIEFSGSSFILGRSGTGKTTVLIMKLVQKEQLYHLAAEGFHKVESNSSASSTLRKDNAGSEVEIKGNILRQIFVTVNVKLCYAVRQYISRLKRSMCGCNSSAEGFQSNLDDIDEASQFSDIPDSFSDIPRSSYPLVITFNKFLMMLDGTVGRSFFGRLLEFTGLSQEKRKGSRSMALKTFIRTKEVHYDKFCSAYWPHFSIQLTKKLDPSTIFAEIVSHIKGGSCVGVQDDKLSREDYISYSRRRLSHLSEQERGTIYDIFIQYEKKKKTRGEFDLSDFVIDLHHRLGDENYEGEKMDFVYVDEVQDLTMRQISLFKYICRNFEDGFVFSGDTAQTIVRGVDFRFKDIKALFYREFTACERNGKGQVSDIFNLSQNFRSHAGVLKLANSVLNLLYHFFPSSVDRLQPETSLVNGEEPVWVQMRNGENTLCSFFKGSGSFDRGIFGFGAEQVILVRDDSHRNEVLNYVGKQALVLTLTECKGLEFQDVLLYNFFSSSPLKDQWEVIYGYMKEQNLIDSPLLKSFPIFNEGKHISLCLELKQLYVAITRTRKRLWIFESRFCSMFNYWEKLHLVQIRELEYNFLQEIQVASSQREWKARGMKFFYQQNYDKARFCFEKAGESYLEKWAVAAGSVSTADQMRDSNPKMADIHLTEAAHIYESIGKNESAALCFFELREYEKAGIIYLEKCGESKLEEAGECFYSAGCYKRAAEIYARCNLFSKCLSACADGKLFEVGYDFIQLWKENKFLIGQGFLESEELQKFLERGALYFQKLQDSESMMKFVKDFQSENLMRTFLKSVDCLDELVLLEKERGNFLEAANVANMKGDILLGVDLLQMGRRFKEASGVILSYVLYNSLWVHGSKGWPLKQFEKKEELLIKAKTYAENVSQHYHNFVCIEADILSHGKSSLFTMEKNWGDSARHGSFRGKILGARKILDAYLYQGTPQHENEVYLVEDLIKYTQNKKSREKTSVGGIVYYWNFWKEEIENILSSIQDTKEDSYSEFCLNYFGVSKQLKNEKTLYLLLYPDAEWVKGANLRNIKRGNSIWIDADQFVWSAIRYWSSEMLTVGVKVLEILEAFYVFSVDNALSLNCKTMLLIEIFRVSKSLIESKFLNHRDSSNILQRFLEIPIKNFFGHIYPLDWRMPMTKDMIYLRDTELSRNLLREVVYRIICSRAIANGQLGMLMTIILSGKFSTNLYMQIATTLGHNISWKEFIENFIQTKSNDNSIEDPSDFDLVVKFHRALADTEYTDFSPSVFLYLVDRLLILVSYLKGYFFTTKSSLVEWLMSRGWNTETNLDYLSDVQVQPLLEETVGFVAHTVNKLICSEPLKWIKRYNLKMEFYPLLVLRLFVVLCLLCINFDGYYDLLFNLLDKREVTSLLPWKFYKSLWRLREHEKAHINIKVVSEALKGIGNPLVVVNLGLHCAEFSFPGAIFLHLNVEQGRKCILQRLFLKNDMFSSNRARCSKLARKDSFGGGISLKINHQEIPSASSFVTTSDPVKAQQTNRNFWAMLGTVEFNPLTDASWLMEMILEYVLLVNATMRCCRRGNCCHSSGSAAGMVNKVRDELQQLYSALDSSEWEVQDNRIIRDLLKKLQLRRKRMEPLLDQLLICDSNKRTEHAALKTSVKDGDSGTAEKSSTGTEASNSTSC